MNRRGGIYDAVGSQTLPLAAGGIVTRCVEKCRTPRTGGGQTYARLAEGLTLPLAHCNLSAAHRRTLRADGRRWFSFFLPLRFPRMVRAQTGADKKERRGAADQPAHRAYRTRRTRLARQVHRARRAIGCDICDRVKTGTVCVRIVWLMKIM